MSLTFAKNVIDDTALLPTISIKFLEEFCRIAFENIQKGGVNKKTYAKAASQIGTEADTVMKAINSLTQVFLQASRLNAGAASFHMALQDLNFSEEQRQLITKYYKMKLASLRSYISNTQMKIQQYHNLDWRLNLQLATRCARHNIKPSFLLELETEDADGNPCVQMMESDYANMKHISDELDRALAETRAKHANRIFRYVKN